jgi:putative flippase GtrA
MIGPKSGPISTSVEILRKAVLKWEAPQEDNMQVGRFQFSTFVVIGALATAIQYAILIGLTEYLRIRPVWASSCGYAISALLNYYLNYRITFRSAKAHRRALPCFLAISTIGLFLNSTAVWALSERAALPYLVAQVVATVFVLVWNFSANKKWTF